MTRPSFQFYPADWRNNAKLRRCSWAARGAWVDVLALMNDSDDYGILHWPLKEIAQAIGCPIALLKELAEKQVLKGIDKGECAAMEYTPRSGRQAGPTVVLIPATNGPIWYSSRMVRDEYIRQKKANPELFKDSPHYSPKPPMGESPMAPFGEGIHPGKGDLPSSSSSSSSSSSKKQEVTTTGDTSTVVGAICVALRRAGVQVSPHQQQVQALAQQDIAVETIAAAAEEARRSKPNERIGIGLVIAILESWAKKAKAMNVAGARQPQQQQSARDIQRAGAMNSIGLGGHHDAQPATFDAATGELEH